MGRLTNNDKQFWIFTYGKSSYNPWRIIFSSGGGYDEPAKTNLTCYGFGYVCRVHFPNFVKPFREWHEFRFEKPADGRKGYWEEHPREFGFSLNDGFLTFYHGPQTNDSITTKSTSFFLPWTQWFFNRYSVYGLNGEHLKSWISERSLVKKKKPFNDYEEQRQFKDQHVPKVKFLIRDADGTEVIATTYIQEREWTFGEGWFQWLRFFRKNIVQRTLEIEFDQEVGHDKGSWKGGLMGTSIEMNPNELHESAFTRFCDQEHWSKNGKFKIEFIKQIEE